MYAECKLCNLEQVVPLILFFTVLVSELKIVNYGVFRDFLSELTSSEESTTTGPRLTGLRHEEANVVAENGRRSIEKVRGQFHHHRQLCQLLQNGSSGHGRVIRCPTRD